MGRITELKLNKSGTQAKLSIDGELVGVVSLETIVRYKLQVGVDLDDEELDGYITESQIRLGFDWLVGYMGSYPCSTNKAKGKLRDKGYHPFAIAEIISKAEEYGYLDDYNYAENYATNSLRTMSKRMVKDKLSQQGVPNDIIQEVLGTVDADEEFDAAYNVALRWSQTKDVKDRGFREKLARYMMSKGYGWDIIGKCYNMLQEEQKDEE